jgi:hypothetical protein
MDGLSLVSGKGVGGDEGESSGAEDVKNYLRQKIYVSNTLKSSYNL